MSANVPAYDVIIVGAGPVGLFLACELRLANVSVLVLEQARSPDSPLKRLPFGMRGLSIPTIECQRSHILARRRDSGMRMPHPPCSTRQRPF